MSTMKYGIVMSVGSPKDAVELAVASEKAGWDGFFMADGMWGLDSWLCLSAAAMKTERIRLGTLLTPLSIMRPWKLAAEAATLDHLSDGRVILTVGMGAPDVGFAAFGETTDLRTRAELVDEGLDIIAKLWRGEAFQHEGKHYQIDLADRPAITPMPIQNSGIPVWVVAAWPRPKSMRRALRCTGIVPVIKPKTGEMRPVEPQDLQDIQAWIEERQVDETPFDYVIEGQTPVNDLDKAQAIVQPWHDAGATWWIESLWDKTLDERLTRMRQGPPKSQ